MEISIMRLWVFCSLSISITHVAVLARKQGSVLFRNTRSHFLRRKLRLNIPFVYLFILGISSVVAPLYLSEIAPVKLRGFFGALYQLTTVLGIITSGVLGLGNILGTTDLWQYALGEFLIFVSIFVSFTYMFISITAISLNYHNYHCIHYVQ